MSLPASMDSAEFRKMYGKAKPRNKYGAVPTVYNGVLYPSKGEANYAAHLDMLVKTGELRGYLRQVTIQLGPDHKTRVDFLPIGKDGSCWAEEFKGRETPQFKTVRRLWPKYGLFPLIIVKQNSSGYSYEKVEGRSIA